MATDIAATSVAFVLFSLFALAPGYILSWALDLLAFRRRTAVARLVIAVPVSIAAFPVLTFLAWRWSIAAVWIMVGACTIASGVVIVARPARVALSRAAVAV